MPDGAMPVLDVRDLKTVFQTRGGEVHAVNDVSFSLRPGELLGVVGESGSGKSVTMMSLLGLLPSPPADVRNGEVKFDNKDLLKISPEDLRKVRGGKVGFVFQDPMTSLNPVYSVGFQLICKGRADSQFCWARGQSIAFSGSHPHSKPDGRLDSACRFGDG